MEAMKKFVYFILLFTAVFVSCKKEAPADVNNDNGKIEFVKRGISIVAGAEMTKVAINPVGTEGSYTGSEMSWEPGDRIIVYHDGVTSNFVTASSGTTGVFNPETDADVITSLDSSKPVIAYYNVTSVAGDGTATFAVPAAQTEGALSNKMPLYAYDATPVVESDRLKITFNPLASVVEFKVSAAPASTLAGFEYNLTKVVLTPKSGATGWTVMTGGTVNPATGAITPSGQSLGAITLSFASSTDIAAAEKHFQMIIGQCQMNNTGATMDWYKGDIQNYTKDIWASKNINFTAENKHVYQPIAQKVVGLANYSDYYSKFYANRNSQANLINYCDDERAVILTADINMLGGTDPSTFRATTFPNLTWNFDGKGHKIFNFLCTDAKRITCLFSNVQADIRNVQFGASGSGARNSIDITDNSNGGTYGIISDISSGTIENVTSYLEWTVTVKATDKACYLGGLVGNMKGGTIRNCYNRGRVNLVLNDGLTTSANFIAGGLVGNSGTTTCTIENCENHADVSVSVCSTGAIFSAGIIGANFQGFSASGCKNYGNISATNTNTTDQSSVGTAQCRAAGIISNVASSSMNSIVGCTNYGDITGTLAAKVKGFQVGGICGNFYSSNGSVAGTETSRIEQRGNVYAYVGGEFDNSAACWFAQFCTNGMTVYASVLNGTKVNATTISSSNYANRNIWCRSDNPGTLTLLTE